MVWNGTTIVLYLNGTVYNTTPQILIPKSDVYDLWIGGSPTWSYSFFNGTIDEVRIYQRALSSDEILCHYGNNCSSYGLWNDTSTLDPGYYHYTARSSGGENYTSSSLLIPLTVLTPPSYSNNSTNSTAASLPTQFSLNWTDDYGRRGA